MKKLQNEALGRVSVEEYKSLSKHPIILVLDDIRSLHNVGAAFRTADAFLIEKIYLCGITGKPPHRDIQKTALGATDAVDWEYCATTLEAIEALKKDNCMIFSVEQVDESISLESFELPKQKRLALVFGNEVFGVKDEVINVSDACIEIPQFGTKHSLNISVSIGVVCWHIVSKII